MKEVIHCLLTGLCFTSLTFCLSECSKKNSASSSGGQVITGPPVLLTITPSKVTVIAGATQVFTVKGLDSNGNSVSLLAAFSLDNSEIGVIDQTGVFSAKKTGTGILTVTAQALTVTSEITVTTGPVASLVISPASVVVNEGDKQQFTVYGTDEYGNAKEKTKFIAVTPLWSINGNIGTIDSTGLFTSYLSYGGKTGKVVVTVGNHAAAADVTVNDRPNVSVQVSPPDGIAPLTVAFNSTCTDYDGTCVSYLWDFGDGSTSTEPDPTHTYQNVGLFQVKLNVTDDNGANSYDYDDEVKTIAASAFTLNQLSFYNISGASGIHLVGNYAYVTSTSSLSVLDVTTPSSPTLAGSITLTSNYGANIHVAGNYAYVAAGNAGLVIYDVSSPGAPSKKSSLDTGGNTRDVFVKDNFAYVADSVSGLKIVDVSNASAPVVKGSYSGASYPSSVVVQGNYAYLADGYTGLLVIDVTNPASPGLKSTYSGDNPLDVFVSGNYAYLLDSPDVKILDISNPASPTLKGTVNLLFSYYYFSSISVSGKYAYVGGTAGLYILDVSNPASPTFAAADLDIYLRNVIVSGNQVYVTRGSCGSGVCSNDGVYIFSAP